MPAYWFFFLANGGEGGSNVGKPENTDALYTTDAFIGGKNRNRSWKGITITWDGLPAIVLLMTFLLYWVQSSSWVN